MKRGPPQKLRGRGDFTGRNFYRGEGDFRGENFLAGEKVVIFKSAKNQFFFTVKGEKDKNR